MYGVGKIGYDKVLDDAEFYMTNFKDVTFENAIWLPGVDETTLMPDGSVRVYGTWKGVSIATGKAFPQILTTTLMQKKVRFTNQVTFSMLAEL